MALPDRDALATQFKALSAQSMADQNERATQSAQRTMSDAQRLLAPVSLALERLDRRLAEVEQERTDMTASLREQVAGVTTAGESLRKETAGLLEQMDLDLPTYYDPHSNTQNYLRGLIDFRYFPTTLLLDRGGVIRAVWVGYRPGLETEMERYIGMILDKES